MRKAGREIREFGEILDVLSRCDTMRLGICDGGTPYVVPLSFGFEADGGSIAVYFHGAKAGRKAELLQTRPRVCVEADLCHGFPENGRGGITCDYESVIGWGFAEELEGEAARRGLDRLLAHCGVQAPACPPEAMAVTAVYSIILDEVTGKHRNLGDPNA